MAWLDYATLAFSIFYEMCVSSLVLLPWNLPAMLILSLLLMLIPDFQSWFYTVQYLNQWIFWTYDVSRARVGTWLLRDWIIVDFDTDIWDPRNLGLMFFVFWCLQIPYALIGIIFSIGFPLLIFSLFYIGFNFMDNKDTLFFGSWEDPFNEEEQSQRSYEIIHSCDFQRYFT